MASNKIDRKKRTVLSVLATALMILVAVFAMVPFAFMFMSSLKPGTEMMRYGLTLRFDPGISSFDNYTALNTYRDGVYWHWYKSSAIIMIMQTGIGLFFGSLVGYGLAMYQFKGRNLIFTLVLVVMMLPFEILLLPMYQMMIRIKMMNTYFGVVIPSLVPPFMIFFFRQYCLGIPRELMEAGRILERGNYLSDAAKTWGRMIDEYKADAVIEMDLSACHTYAIETRAVKKFVENKGIPYMALETDYSSSDIGQLTTRIAAFIEML